MSAWMRYGNQKGSEMGCLDVIQQLAVRRQGIAPQGWADLRPPDLPLCLRKTPTSVVNTFGPNVLYWRGAGEANWQGSRDVDTQ
jgi:hypothetical protein